MMLESKLTEEPVNVIPDDVASVSPTDSDWLLIDAPICTTSP